MNLDNFLISGGHGMVGININFGLKPTSSEMNINNYSSIKNFINNKKIECIIHLAAINLREAESDVKKAINTNINGTTNLVKIAKELNIPIVYVSTGAVFSANNTHEKFNEFSETKPNCVYGYTKAAGEKIVLLYEKGIIVRTGWLFGGNQKNHYKFVENAVNNLILDKNIYGSTDFYGSPTYVIDLIEKIIDLTKSEKYGIFHIINNGYASGYEIGLEVAKILNKDTNFVIGNESSKIPNSGPFRSNSEILVSEYEFLKMRDWKVSLNEYIQKYLNIKNDKKSIIKEEKIYLNRNKCRLCCNSDIITAFKLEETPFANNFVEKKIYQECVPLDICKCNKCNHIQLRQIIDPKLLYENYFYVSSTSNTMIKHLQKSVDFFIEYLNLKEDNNILEIGANDGVCVDYLLKKKFKNTIGVDPAKNIKERNNLPIICDFFGEKLYDQLNNNYGKFKLIFGFHCCAHIENVRDVFNTAFRLLDDDGVFVMEVGYFYEVLKNKTFDTIYHEHIDYYTCIAVQNYCNNNGLKLFNAIKTDIQGGSIQFYICKNTDKRKVSENVNILLNIEKEENIHDINNLIKWYTKIKNTGEDLNMLVKSIKANNKKIAGYGASAKSTTFMHQFGLSDKIIEYIIDDNIYKINHYSPGLNIPIKSIEELDNNKVDYIIILSWNFKKEIINKLENYIKRGIKIIVPFPNIEII